MANDKKEQDFPGYPHHAPQEDITQPNNNNGRVDAEKKQKETNTPETDNEIPIVMGTEADVTPEERQMLEAVDGYTKTDNTDEDGDLLNENNDYAGTDLDVPGSELDDANEEIGEEDEENNYYSRSDNDDADTDGTP